MTIYRVYYELVYYSNVENTKNKKEFIILNVTKRETGFEMINRI
jgi:hypothetical protein